MRGGRKESGRCWRGRLGRYEGAWMASRSDNECTTTPEGESLIKGNMSLESCSL